jgi:PKD repeat protein
MKKTLLSFFMLFGVLSLNAQNFQKKIFYAITTDEVSAKTGFTLSDGSRIIISDEEMATNGSFISKVNATGTVVWTKQLNQVSAEGIAPCANGDIAVTGVSFDLSSPGYGYIARLSSTGTLIWEKSMKQGSTNNTPIYNSVLELSSGYILFGGQFGGYDWWTINANGATFQFHKNYQNSGVLFNAIEYNNSIYSAGLASDPVNFNNTFFIVKNAMSNSASLARKQYKVGTSTSYGQIQSIKKTANNQLIVCGYNQEGPNQINSWVMRLDTSLNLIWAKEIKHSVNDNYAFDLMENPDGTIMLCGRTTQFAINDWIGYVTKLSSTGNLLWSKKYANTFEFQKINYINNSADVIGAHLQSAGLMQDGISLMNIDLNGAVAGCAVSNLTAVTVVDRTANITVTNDVSVVPAQTNPIIALNTYSFITSITNHTAVVTTICSGTPIVANFSASATTINAGSSVNFTDLSTGGPTSWSWNFGTGASPLTSTVQNPSNIVFNTPGCYTVTLTASNGANSDAETKTCYITVNAPPSSSFLNGYYSNIVDNSVYCINTTSDGGYILGVEEDGTNGSLLKLDNAGAITWQKDVSVTGTTTLRLYDVKQTSDGGYIACGASYTFGTHAGIVIKFSSTGTVVWSKKYVSSGLVISSDASVNLKSIKEIGTDYIVCGIGVNLNSVVAMKINSTGTVIWEKILSPSGSPLANVFGVFTDVMSNGNYAFISTISNNGQKHGLMFTEINTNGTVVNNKAYYPSTTNSLIGYKAKKNSDGTFIIAGAYESVTATTSMNDNTIAEGALVKLDATGNLLWCRSYDYLDYTDYNDDMLRDVIQTADGGYAALGNILYTIFSNSYTVNWTLKVDASGVTQWNNAMNFNSGLVVPLQLHPTSFHTRFNGAVCANADGTFTTASESADNNFSPVGVNNTIVVNKIGANGNAGTCSYTNVNSSEFTNTLQSITTTVSVIENVTALNETATATAGNFTMFNNCGGLTVGLTDEPDMNVSLKVYPNPFNTTITIEEAENADLIVYNDIGQVTHTEKLKSNSQIINTNNWLAGIYFIMVKDINYTKTLKVIKQN